MREHLGIGATAIGQAYYEATERYAQAFFALSVGFERAAKLVLTLDAAVSSQGQFLDGASLRRYGHRIDHLFGEVDRVARARGISDARLPDTPIHRAILRTVTDFASNLGRYYNLEVLSPEGSSRDDPIGAWYARVTKPVLQEHDTERRRSRDEAKIAALVPPANVFVSVVATSEAGDQIRDVADLMRRRAEANAARPWERMYVLQLARFVTRVIGELASLAQQTGLYVPFLDEYFYEFQLDDGEFRRLKIWPPRR